jgi:LuxR family maltose regulon positive regulatory protein
MSVAKVVGSRSSEQIANHKLFPPPEHLGAIRRDAILNRILAGGDTRVVLLQGPAGHGKSTLMQQIKSEGERRGWITGWLGFEEADNDIRSFFTHLEALLAVVDRNSGAEPGVAAEAAVVTGRLSRSDWFLNRLIRFDRPVGLFFDEFQTLSSKPVFTFFRSLLEHIPQNVHIFIGSRTVPDIGLARLVVNKQALILRADDLRFSPAEVTQFFAEARELDMRRDEIDAIYGRTEGWPAALQLYRLSLGRPEVRKSLSDLGTSRPRQLAEYLADNVLALQPPRVRDFLLRTSLLSRLSGPLCDAVMGREGSSAILRELEQSGLFLRSLDAEMRWFRYHTLFSSFLADQLRELSEDVVRDVHLRAAQWYRDNGIYDEAMHHAIAARDFRFAADVFDIWATQLTMDANLMTVERWYDRLPLDEIERHPALVIKVAYALAFLRRREKLGPILKMLEKLARKRAPSDAENPAVIRSMVMIIQDDTLGAFEIAKTVNVNRPEAEGFTAFELGAAGNLKGYLAMTAGDFEAAREYLMLARAHGDRANAGFSWGYSISTAGMNLMAQGQLAEALERFRIGVAEPRIALDESVASASLVSCYVQALYESNELEAAKSLFGQYHDIIANAAMHDYLVVSYITMARIHDAQGLPAKAAEVLDEAEVIGHGSLWPRVIRIVGWERVRRALIRGETDRAYSIASRIMKDEHPLPEGWVRFGEDAEGDAIGEIRLAIHERRTGEAIAQIGRELAVAVKQGRVRRQIKLHILDALAQHHQHSEHGSQRSLQKALQLAAPGPFVRTFLEEGEEVVQLLQESYQNLAAGAAPGQASSGGQREFIRKLLDASGTELGAAQMMAGSRFQPLEALTDREKGILQLLVNGASNKVLAKKMFVSENTVKFHLKNIYSKLGVGSRLQAISAARQMGLL